MNIGQYNKLKIERQTDSGYYLNDEEDNEVLLPNRYLLDSHEIGDYIDVFIYKDSEDRLVATTEEPLIKLNEFAVLNVVESTRIGTFMDWGLQKDLFIPYKEQTSKMESGEPYVIRMYLDNETDRLVGSNKISKFLDNTDLSELSYNQEVNILIYGKSDLGYKAIINDKYDGLLYYNEVFNKIAIGDYLSAFIKKIREDNKIDLSFRKLGYDSIDPLSDKILDKLKESGGTIGISDKSNPELIKKVFNCSKKQFKKAIGNLYRRKIIKIHDENIELT